MSSRKCARGLVVAAVLLTAWAGQSAAQQTDASITGVVMDAHDAAVAGAEVVATNVETGVKSSARTNNTGLYSLRPLPIGVYRVTVEQAGFRQYERAGIVLSTGLMLELNVSLEVGLVSESVTVTAHTALSDSRSWETSQIVEAKSIEELPLGDRNALNIVEITGAALFVKNETGGPATFSLAGGRVRSQMSWLDGGSGQDSRMAPPTNNNPPIENLQEMRIIVNGSAAEFGASASGVVVATTKSGTNRVKGSLFEYFRNERLDAANYFSNVVDGVRQRPSLRYNVFGGTVGGPIRRNHTFFFVAYEGTRRGDGAVRTLTVPSLLERTGDFSQTFGTRGLAVIYDPASSRLVNNAVLRDPFPSNRITEDRIDPVAARLVPFFPLPNRNADDLSGANNFRLNDVNRSRRYNLTIKLDHAVNHENRVTLRYSRNPTSAEFSSVYPNPAANTFQSTEGSGDWWYGAWTRILSSNLINELRLTYRTSSFHTYGPGGEGWPSKLGLNGVSDEHFPRIELTGYAFLGSADQDRLQSPQYNAQLAETLSWVRGRHSVKVGAEVRPSYIQSASRPTTSGRYGFSKGLTGRAGDATTGNGFATMLLGTPTLFTTQENDELDRRMWYHAGFAQTDWTVSRLLTVNLGVRWELDTPLADANNAMNGFDPVAINPISRTAGVPRFLGQKGFYRAYESDWNNFGPRFGFAWRPFGLTKTVVRSGYGIFFAHPFDRTEVNTAILGFSRSAQLTVPDTNVGLPYTIGRGIPVPSRARQPLDDSFGAVAPGINPNQAVSYFEPNRRTGYSQQFNFRIQHELPGQMAIEYGYLGNLARKLPSSDIGINQVPPQLLGPSATFRNRPFPQFTQVNLMAPTFGVSSYHAGTVKLEKRFSRGYNLLATYTWAKSLDNCESVPLGTSPFGGEFGPYSNYYDRRADWGPSEIDVRHRFTWSSVWQLPFGKGRSLRSNRWTRVIAGGWSMGAVFAMQSGGPVTVNTATNTTGSLNAGAQLRADILANPNLPSSERSLLRWFDTNVFRQPADYTFGNQAPGHIRADGIVTLNGSLLRTFVPVEGTQLQFRADMLNAPNHPDFLVPGRTLGGAGFGVISGARQARQIQLGLKLTF